MKKLFLLSFLCTIPVLMNASLDQEQPCDPCERFEYYSGRANLASNTPAQYEELYANKLSYKSACEKKNEERIKVLKKQIEEEVGVPMDKRTLYMLTAGVCVTGLVLGFIFCPIKE